MSKIENKPEPKKQRTYETYLVKALRAAGAKIDNSKIVDLKGKGYVIEILARGLARCGDRRCRVLFWFPFDRESGC